MWQDYQLGNNISRITEDTKLWQSERGIVQTYKNTLVIPIKTNEQEIGYIFHGNGRLILDAIVETEEGAVGRPVEKDLDKPFLMLGGAKGVQQHFIEASEEDFTKAGYGNQQAFTGSAKDMFNRFFKKAKTYNHHGLSELRGFIFAFQNETDKLSILVISGSKLVYTARNVVFISNKDKVVLQNPSEILCSSHGKSITIWK